MANSHSGAFSVSRATGFSASKGIVTYAGATKGEPQYARNPEVVETATEARVTSGTKSNPPKLLLVAGGEVVAVYERESP